MTAVLTSEPPETGEPVEVVGTGPTPSPIGCRLRCFLVGQTCTLSADRGEGRVPNKRRRYDRGVRRMGSVDDPVWLEPPPVDAGPNAYSEHPRWLIPVLVAILVVVILLALAGWWLFSASQRPPERVLDSIGSIQRCLL